MLLTAPPVENNPSSLSQVLQELKTLQNVIVKNNEDHKKIIGRLTEGVITLQNGVRQLKSNKGSCMIGDEEQELLPKFPIDSSEELGNLEENLHSNTLLAKQLKRLILRVGGEYVPTFLRTTLRKLMTDELATKYTWSGTKVKPSIQNFFFISLIRGILIMKRFRKRNLKKNK